MIKGWIRRVVLIGLACFFWVGSSVAIADVPPSDAVTLFETHCAACHPQGGNIIRRGKTLKLKALEKNAMDTPEAIATIITQGKNNMSAFGDKLNTQEIQALSAYVLAQAQKNWA